MDAVQCLQYLEIEQCNLKTAFTISMSTYEAVVNAVPGPCYARPFLVSHISVQHVEQLLHITM